MERYPNPGRINKRRETFRLSAAARDPQALDPESAFPGHGVMKPKQQEIERLHRELARMKAECDILKKAAAYFVRDSI